MKIITKSTWPEPTTIATFSGPELAAFERAGLYAAKARKALTAIVDTDNSHLDNLLAEVEHACIELLGGNGEWEL